MNGASILVVEDDENDEALIRLAFEKAGVVNQIDVVKSCTAAVQYLQTNPLPSVLLLDLHLIGAGGFEVLKFVRATEKTRLLPVVILTSSNLEEDIVESYNLGANAFLQKPVNLTVFIEAIKAVGLFWLRLPGAPTVH